jgi:rubrerythrin
VDGRELDHLKGGILLERRGRAFYDRVAAGTESSAVAALFTLLSEEEGRHQAWLERMFVELSTEGAATGFTLGAEQPAVADAVLIESVCNQIRAASFEAAAVSAAMALEQRAVDYYSGCAKASADAESRKLCTLLSDWEQTHLELLARIDREIQQSIWLDNRFWPSI